MRRSRCTWLILFGLCSSPAWAGFPGLRYLGDIGDLGIPGNPRTSVRFGRVKVVSSSDGILFQGRDDDGKRWQAALPVAQGLGSTAVWQADFDHNSRQDLLIAAYYPKNGRCTIEVTLSFLLFNDHGQPVPWVIQTEAPSWSVPAIFADLDHNGRAELVATVCTYSDPSDHSRFGADHRITGVYKAKNAAWSLVKPSNLAPYTSLVRQSHRFHRGFDLLLPSNPADWTDQGNRLDAPGSPPIEVVSVMTASESCRGVRLPPIVDGRIQIEGWKDPCDEEGHNRIRLSNGTVCYDWPTVVLDDENGREIVAGSEHPEPLLQKIVKQHHSVTLAGQRDPNRCSPALLWAGTQ